MFENGTNETDCSKPPESILFPYIEEIMYTLYSIVFIISLFGNGIICYIVLSSPRMRTVTNYFIMNLAIGDIFITILCIPFTAITTLEQHWIFPPALCPMVNYSQGISVFVSAYTLVAISVDRYVAIMWPLKPRLSKKCSWVIIFMVWFFSGITAMPIALSSKAIVPDDLHYEKCKLNLCTEVWSEIGTSYGKLYSKTILFVQYIFPVSVLIFTYTSIAIMIWCHRIPGEAENCRDQRIAKSKRKMIKMMIAVVIVYTLCWLPLNAFWVIRDMFKMDDSTTAYFFFSSHWLAMSHTCYNPIIYCYMNARFRSAFLQTIGTVPCIRRCCTSIFILNPSTSFPLTSVEGTGSTILHRNNTYTTYISMRRKNGSRLHQAPVRSASMMRSPHVNNQQVVRRYRYNNNIIENAI